MRTRKVQNVAQPVKVRPQKQPIPQQSGSTVEVIYGSEPRLTMPLVGKSVRGIRDMLRSAYNLDPQAVAVINGNEVNDDYIVKEKDTTLEFIKQAGTKG